ncbi:MAG TPA: methyltransferase domain-containing protein [Dehalococcoidia bacterium]|nr:methyltransferase domain-containing protein [Dehalococcoidia bacterium]
MTTQVIVAAALFRKDGRALVVRRSPFARPALGRWFLPATAVPAEQTVEEALRRHVGDELGVEIAREEFVDTLYIEYGGVRYVASVFDVLSYEGKLRFRAGGDYEDARFLNAEEIEQIVMPSALREWLVRELRGEAHVPSPELVAAVATAAPVTRPDNRAAWNTIARHYQERHAEDFRRVAWGIGGPYEDDLRLLGDVKGKRLLEIGCGGGQHSILLARQGARCVGVDLSDEQVKFARRLAEREGVDAEFYQGDATDLSMFDAEQFDAAHSVFALQYVDDIDACYREVFRVLKPGGRFVFSVDHPVFRCFDDRSQQFVRPYWTPYAEWDWEFPGVKARMHANYRPLSDELDALRRAGFVVERLLEPQPQDHEALERWLEPAEIARAQYLPVSVIFVARRPEA